MVVTFTSTMVWCRCHRHVRLFYILLILLQLPYIVVVIQAVIRCPYEGGNGYCPTGNTCCLYFLDSNQDDAVYMDHHRSGNNDISSLATSACIPNDLGSDHATCCGEDNFNDTFRIDSGCPAGYTCAKDDRISTISSNSMSSSESSKNMCLASDNILNRVVDTNIFDPLLTELPRYLLYPCPQIQSLYGYSMQRNLSDEKSKSIGDPNTLDINNRKEPKKLAYYSSHGNIQPNENDDHTWMYSIYRIIIVIHGANRNADDYFCSMHTTIVDEFKNKKLIDETLLLVPWFVSSNADDTNIRFENGGIPYRWNTTADSSGPWRYGANADQEDEHHDYDDCPSSYELIDHLVLYVMNEPKFKHLKEIKIIGHSSGGQFVQRYSIISSVSDIHQPRRLRMRFIAINPSSYAYLTPARPLNTESAIKQEIWRLPNTDEISKCPSYNEWEWGIGNAFFDDYEQDGILSHEKDTRSHSIVSSIKIPPYVLAALRQYVTIQNLTQMLANRDVIYLVGGLDVCNIPGSKQGWCNSHGLETSCNDMMQGSNRLERHYWYCQSLYQVMNISTDNHKCFIVPNVGHDHSLMFSSPMGRVALFGGYYPYYQSDPSIIS